VNTVVYEPSDFLMVASSSSYDNIPILKKSGWVSFNMGFEKKLISKAFFIKSGNKNSKFPGLTYNNINIENSNYYNWELVETETNSNKFFFVSDVVDTNNYLSFQKSDRSGWGWGWSSLNGGINDSYEANLVSKENATSFEIEYFSTVSNNTYLIFATFVINNVKVKLYLTKNEFSIQLLPYIVNGSIWGFNNAL
jgi:hypothetical protein